MSQRNYALDALKLILACCIVALHFNWKIIPRGYLSVEFFFVISGFLLYKTQGYLKYNPLNAIKRVYPVYLVSIITIIFFSSQSYDMLSIFLSFLILQSIGLNDTVVNVPSWFLCVYLISMPFIAYLIKRTVNNKALLLGTCALISIFSYSMLYLHTPSKGFNYSFEFKVLGITVGLWRCWAGICLGVLAGLLSEVEDKLNLVKATVLEISLLVFFIIVFCFSGWSPDYDFVSLPMIVLSVVILSKRSGLIAKYMDLAFRRLRIPASLSTNIFLLHFPVIMVMSEADAGHYQKFYIACAFMFTCVVMILNIKGAGRPPQRTM